jgi:iron complex outermembrane receptor protein
MRMIRVAVLLSCLALVATGVARADEKKGSGYESYSLGEVYITGEKTPVTKEASITNEITSEEMKATNSRTVAEALAHVPGMTVTTGRKNQPNVNIHGFFDQGRILVLVDGVPYYETKVGFLDLNQFSTDNVAKIEITKGAASVLYGANAEGGVINIITKKATEKPYFGINVEGGEIDYFKTSASHGMKKGIFNYWLNYEHSQAHGWGLSDDFIPVVGTIVRKPGGTSTGIFEDGGTRNQSDYSKDSFWAKFGLEPSVGSEYSVNLHYISRDYGMPPSLLTVNVFPNRPNFSNFFRFNRYDDWGIDLSGQQKIGDRVTLKGKVFYHNHVDGLQSYPDQSYSYPFAYSNYYDYMIGGSLIAQIETAPWNTVRLAFNYRGDSHKQRDDSYLPFESFFSWTGSAGIEDEMTLAKNFSVVVGASYDWFKVTHANKNNTDKSGNLVNQTPLGVGPGKDSFNPMIGATYVFPDSTKLFASVARKTRFPTLQQYFDSKAGNSSLKPEAAINSTIGASRNFADFMWGELAFFYHDISDFIMRSESLPNAPFINIGQVEIYGIEAMTEFYPMKDLVLKLGYNFNHALDQSENKVTDLVANVPEHKLDMGIQYSLPWTKTRLDLNGILISEIYNQVPNPTNPTQEIQSVAGYVILNARVSQKFLKNYEAYIAFNNLFDRNYEEQYGFPGSGRTIFGGVSAKF